MKTRLDLPAVIGLRFIKGAPPRDAAGFVIIRRCLRDKIFGRGGRALAVSSFMVRQRRRQVGIRCALGATRGDIIRYFLVESTVATAVGTTMGLLVTLGLFALAGLFNQGDFTFNGRTVIASAILLWLLATVATVVPARPAAQVPPWVASWG